MKPRKTLDGIWRIDSTRGDSMVGFLRCMECSEMAIEAMLKAEIEVSIPAPICEPISDPSCEPLLCKSPPSPHLTLTSRRCLLCTNTRLGGDSGLTQRNHG